MDNAFQLALTTDPLADSGEEDEDARCDYSELCGDAPLPIRILNRFFPMLVFRLHAVNRLRGRAPTPEGEERDITPSTSTPINIMRHSDGQDMSASPDTTPPDQWRFC